MSNAENLRQDAERYAVGGLASPDMAAAMIAEIPALTEVVEQAQRLVEFWDADPDPDADPDGQDEGEYREDRLREALGDFVGCDQYRVPMAGFDEVWKVLRHVIDNLEPDSVNLRLLRAVQLRLLRSPSVIVLNDVQRALRDLKSEQPKALQEPAKDRPFQSMLVPDVCDVEDVAAALKIDVAAAERIMQAELPHREVKGTLAAQGKMVCDRKALMAWISDGKVITPERTWDATNQLAVAAMRFLRGRGTVEEIEVAEMRLRNAATADRVGKTQGADKLQKLLDELGELEEDTQ